MITIFVHRNNETEQVTSLERAWLGPGSGVLVWLDLASPSIPESLILSDTFGFHPLAVEDAMSTLQYPKIEPYDGHLYVVLHGIDFRKANHGFATHDVDFFLGRHFLVTVHDGYSRSIAALREHCPRNHALLGDGPVALFHRIVDAMVDHYRPEVEKLEETLDEIEEEVFSHDNATLIRAILDQKRDVASLRRVVSPQRDVIARLARREFVDISSEMALRFRDVYDHLVRLNDEAYVFQDRISGILDAHLTSVSNRLNQVMKLLTVLTTVFMPLTVISGLWGMNIPLPHFPGGPAAQFWWVVGLMFLLIVSMLTVFRRIRWI
ncbi:MAG: magnesium/cobalt transporter CorA [Acidimicrobiia bacterium]|nr:magnesium/cobalt transporter CorA [Acidimicrobiia bacterium]